MSVTPVYKDDPFDSRVYWLFQGSAYFADSFSYLFIMLVCVMLSCLFLAALWSPAGRGWPLGSLVCGVFLYFCCFSMWCPRSGVVLGCIKLLIFAFFFTLNNKLFL